MNTFHKLIASGFGAGFCPVAPGTAGALLATSVWIVLYYFSPCLLFPVTICLILLFTVLGIWSSNVLEPAWGKDPSCIVVDEMVGVWIALLAVTGASVYYAALAFALFRLFDIFKPLGIRKLENLKGGWGVMMDDILAGVYSLIIVWGVVRLVG
jgi:phosphatidylglycerophosphatase A